MTPAWCRCMHCGKEWSEGQPSTCQCAMASRPHIVESNVSVCAKTLQTALELTGGDRAKQHGDKKQNHQNIADLWNAYFATTNANGDRIHMAKFTAHDVAVMMCLLKIARLKSGVHNPDNYVDLAGYAGVAAECADA